MQHEMLEAFEERSREGAAGVLIQVREQQAGVAWWDKGSLLEHEWSMPQVLHTPHQRLALCTRLSQPAIIISNPASQISSEPRPFMKPIPVASKPLNAPATATDPAKIAIRVARSLGLYQKHRYLFEDLDQP